MTVLTIASMNFAAQATSWQRQTFAGRLDDIAESVDYYHPAVLCGQEAGNPSRTRALTQVFKDDVRGNLRRAPGGGNWKYIWYDADKLHLNGSGSMKLNPAGSKRAAWAKLTTLDTAETFFVTSAHLSASFLGTDAARRREANRLLDTTNQLNPRRHPEIHAGDYNSVSDVGQAVMKPRRRLDARSIASLKQHTGYNTYNGRTTVVPHASTQQLDGEHLDHVYVSDDLRERVLLWSSRASVKASDHNIIAIKVSL